MQVFDKYPALQHLLCKEEMSQCCENQCLLRWLSQAPNDLATTYATATELRAAAKGGDLSTPGNPSRGGLSVCARAHARAQHLHACCFAAG